LRLQKYKILKLLEEELPPDTIKTG